MSPKSKPQINKVVLAYSGGLDTSVIVPWLKENYNCEVVCFCADVGQGDEHAQDPWAIACPRSALSPACWSNIRAMRSGSFDRLAPVVRVVVTRPSKPETGSVRTQGR